MPGDEIIEQGEIKKAINGEIYSVYGENGDPVYLPVIDVWDFWNAYKMWENYHYFGLPPSVDWSDGESQFLELIKIGEKAWQSTETWRREQASKPTVRK